MLPTNCLGDKHQNLLTISMLKTPLRYSAGTCHWVCVALQLTSLTPKLHICSTSKIKKKSFRIFFGAGQNPAHVIYSIQTLLPEQSFRHAPCTNFATVPIQGANRSPAAPPAPYLTRFSRGNRLCYYTASILIALLSTTLLTCTSICRMLHGDKGRDRSQKPQRWYLK